MATASRGDEPGERECSVCNELLSTPKLLPCGHHLCRHCLVSWIQTKADAAACPLCRCAILPSEEKKAEVDAVRAGAIADGFPTDLFMEKLVEAERMLSKDHSCRACEDVAATAVCLQCWDPLCSTCKKAHKKLSMSKNHAVEDLASLTAEKLASKRPSVCPTHPEEACRLYCASHATSICWLCASTRHRACSDLTELDGLDEEGSRSLDDLVDALTAGETDIERAIALVDQHWERTERSTRAAIALIEETRRRFSSSVEAWEARLKEQTWTEYEYIQAAVKEAKEHLLRRRGKLSTHKGVVRQGREMKNRDVVNKMVTAIRTRIEELDSKAVLPVDAKVVSALEVILDQEAVSLFERELSSLGQVLVSSAEDTGIVKPTILHFHVNHGRHIRLSSYQQTATKSGRQYGCGLVLASEPMKHGFLYEVKLTYEYATVSKRRHKLECVSVGAVTEAPHTINLPDNSTDLQSAFVRNRHLRLSPQSQIQWQLPVPSDALSSLRSGDRVGVCLGSDNRLRVYVNAEEYDTFVEEVPQPCYALFELKGKAEQVTAMPVTKLTGI